MIVDSHCHLDFEDFDDDRDQVLASAKSIGIEHIVVPAISSATWPRLKKVCDHYLECHAAYGLHPYYIDKHCHSDLDKLDQWIKREQPVAVGECGLDFFLKDLDKNKQQEFFEAQLDIANENQLPVVIHSRKATEQVILCLKKYPSLTGMIHSYSGSLEQARQLIDMGFYISFGGAITYDRASKLHSIAAKLPLEKLLVETDAPDQPGLKHHGQRNQPYYIFDVIETLARLRNDTVENISHITSSNAIALFSL
ncbi:MAG: TatD family hydrolase [Gammaproteobacteria bacterium]|nr:TatD family hydrolase [Gammaproteobacteria bacterium]